MVAEQLVPHGVTDPRVLEAMASIPRDEFLSGRAKRHAYEDRALAIECGQTISQPLVVALMTQSLELSASDAVLEVGTGSGYQAAVLSRLCRHVLTLELEPALAEHASSTLRRLGFDNVDVAVADGSGGWPAGAPYDAVLVACAATELPRPLVEQLTDGGRLVIPMNVGSDQPQDLRLYVKRDGEVTHRSLFPVVFVPLRRGGGAG
jgi:protein-L-isoaspartate(D-aspartate) O-methyltransferase